MQNWVLPKKYPILPTIIKNWVLPTQYPPLFIPTIKAYNLQNDGSILVQTPLSFNWKK